MSRKGPAAWTRQQSQRDREEAATRKLLVGSGDRSERIRTYNFPQGRVTDHRINLTLYKLDEILTGNLDPLIEPLTMEYQADQLAALGGPEKTLGPFFFFPSAAQRPSTGVDL